jgi:hypothetical protein
MTSPNTVRIMALGSQMRRSGRSGAGRGSELGRQCWRRRPTAG